MKMPVSVAMLVTAELSTPEAALNKTLVTTLVCTTALLLSACEKKGPMERAGEKVDETARTIKNGGERTPSDKVRDAASDARKDVEKAADDVNR